MEFNLVKKNDGEQIKELSQTASAIVREYFTPLIGAAQNEYMIGMFQTEEAIADQLNQGVQYYFADSRGKHIGFFAICPKEGKLYLSKFYLDKDHRGKGFGREMFAFIECCAKKMGISKIFLNVNRHNPVVKLYEHMGFQIIRQEKNHIGKGFVMDDYVMEYDVQT